MASQEGHHDVVQTLLGAGADINITRSLVSGTCTLSHSSFVDVNNIHYNIVLNINLCVIMQVFFYLCK